MSRSMEALVGSCPAVETLRAEVRKLVARIQGASRPPSVLIQGETGAGKGLLAGVLRRVGPRSDGPFVEVNCAAIPENLLEAELFGYERGAFTDARRSKPGLFQIAHRGTIFLDEIALLPESLQAKLLKVLEERSVRRLGATENEPVDVWVISATNADLATAVAQRRFREDLYHRLAVVTLALPPLRERGEDIVALAEHFLDRACADYRLPSRRLAADARARLLAYPWPGNVRELANTMERAALMADSRLVTASMLGIRDAPVAMLDLKETPAERPRGAVAGSRDEVIRDQMRAVLDQTGWNVSQTAALLGITRNTVRARIQKFGLRRDERELPVRGPDGPGHGLPVREPDGPGRELPVRGPDGPGHGLPVREPGGPGRELPVREPDDPGRELPVRETGPAAPAAGAALEPVALPPPPDTEVVAPPRAAPRVSFRWERRLITVF